MSQEPTISDLFEMMVVIRDNAVTKEDLKDFVKKDDLKNFATKDDLKVLERKMDEGFSSLSGQIYSIELELSDIKKRLDRIEKRTLEDEGVLFQEVQALKKRVSFLEQQVHPTKQTA